MEVERRGLGQRPESVCALHLPVSSAGRGGLLRCHVDPVRWNDHHHDVDDQYQQYEHVEHHINDDHIDHYNEYDYHQHFQHEHHKYHAATM